MKINYLFCDWSSHQDLLMQVRHAVFIDEQQVPEALEIDEWDSQSKHILALDGDTPIATARLLPDGHIGRMCVLKAYRGQGIGLHLLHRLIEKAKAQGIQQIKLNAQTSAIGFYQKASFKVSSDTFMDAGIEHKAMILALNHEIDDFKNNPLPIEINSKQLAQEAAVKLVAMAKRSICILSQELEPTLYNQTALCQHISQLIRHNSRCHIKIVCKSSTRASSQNHCLITLAQRFSSFIEIRTITHKDFIKFQQSWLLIDDHAYCQLNNPERFIGKACFYNKLQVKEALDFFEQVWEHSEVDQNTRRLSL